MHNMKWWILSRESFGNWIVIYISLWMNELPRIHFFSNGNFSLYSFSSVSVVILGNRRWRQRLQLGDGDYREETYWWCLELTWLRFLMLIGNDLFATWLEIFRHGGLWYGVLCAEFICLACGPVAFLHQCAAEGWTVKLAISVSCIVLYGNVCSIGCIVVKK